jgi:hypothetical protein
MGLAAEAMAASAQTSFVQPTQVAALYAHAGDDQSAFDWLERAYEGRDSWMVFHNDDQRFDALRHDPRFDSLLQRMSFP